MTITEATHLTQHELKKIYEDGEAIAISNWLIEHITGVRASTRITQQKELEPEKVSKLHSHLERLKQHEPLQYVLNEAWFCGLKFYVDKRVLIPRPETEELVEWIISNARFPLTEMDILDIGSGSGCIPIALKRRMGKSNVTSIDISKDALEIAKKNASELNVDVKFRELDFLSAASIAQLPAFDIIVSNPPYIPMKDRGSMDQNVVNYEPAIALFVADDDALIFYRAIAETGKKLLNPGGNIYVETHEDLASKTNDLFQNHGYETELKNDMQGKQRMIRASLK